MLLSWELRVWAATHLQQFITSRSVFLPVSCRYLWARIHPVSCSLLSFSWALPLWLEGFLFILLRPSLLYTTVLHPSSQAELFILRGSEVVHAKPHVSREVNRQLPRDVFLKMREGIRVGPCLYLWAPLWHTVDASILRPWSSWSGFQSCLCFSWEHSQWNGRTYHLLGMGLSFSLEFLKVEESSHHRTHVLSVPTPTPVVIKFKEVLSHLDGCSSKNKRAYT